MILDQFITPWGKTIKAYTREGTVDWNTLQSCLVEDEYQIGKLPDKGLAIDLGVYIGAATLTLLSRGWDVYGAEPLLENVELANKNIQLNDYKAKIYHNAVTSSKKPVEVYYGDLDTETGRVHEFIGATVSRKKFNPEVKDGRSAKVKSITLEDIFKESNIERCNFLKVDIEGGEWEIFENISEDLLDRIDRIAVEIDGAVGKPTSTEEFMKLLKGKFVDVSQEYFPNWSAPGTSVHGYFINKKL